MSEENAELLCSLASDFKKYYFEIWRSELASQRATSQFTLLLGHINELKRENVRLQTEINELKDALLKQKECVSFVYSQTRMLTEQFCDLANIITSDGEADLEKK